MTEQQHYDANDVLMGGGSGAPGAKFPRTAPGTTIGGRIVAKPEARQEREFDRNNPGGGAPKFFPSGDPIMGVVVTVQTDLRDPSIEDDDGRRRLFIEGKRLKTAVKDAVIASGSKLEVGGELYVTFTGLEGDPSDPQAAKTWAARYVPASATAANDALGVTQQAVPAPPAAPPAASSAAPDPVTTARSLLALGTAPADVAQATGLDLGVVTALANLPAA